MRKLKLPGRNSEGPRLNDTDFTIIEDEGIPGIKKQARQIVERKLREQLENDGKQTPHAGNPVYKAMHACKCSSRREISRAHRIPAGRDLNDNEIDSIVNLLTRWIVREYNFYIEEEKAQQKNLNQYDSEE